MSCSRPISICKYSEDLIVDHLNGKIKENIYPICSSTIHCNSCDYLFLSKLL